MNDIYIHCITFPDNSIELASGPLASIFWARMQKNTRVCAKFYEILSKKNIKIDFLIKNP